MIKMKMVCISLFCLVATASVDAGTTYGDHVSGLWKSFDVADGNQTTISNIQGIAFDRTHQTDGVYDWVYLANHSAVESRRGLFLVDLTKEKSSPRLALGSHDEPSDVAVAPDGTVCVSYSGNPAVYRVENATGKQSTSKVLGNYGGSGDDDIGDIALVPPAFAGGWVAGRDLLLFDCGRDGNANSAVGVFNRERGEVTTLWNSGSTVNTIRGDTSSFDGYAYFVDYDMPSGDLEGVALKYINRVRGDGVVERVFLNINPSKLPRLDSAIVLDQIDGSLWMAVNDGNTRNVFRVDVAHAVWQREGDYLADTTLEIGDLGYDVANYSMAISPDGKLLAIGSDSGIDKIYVYNIVSAIDPDSKLGKIIINFRNAYNGNILIAAHRGDHKNFPENSVEGMVSAAGLGADIVEVDVQKTKDGVLVLSHDKTLDRATNGSGAIPELTFSEIQKFFLKNPDGSISNLKIPTLRSVMLAMKGKAMIMLDKSFNHFDDCLDLSRELGMMDQVIFKSSKTLDEMEIVLKKNPDVYYGYGIEDKKKNYINLYIQCIKQLRPQMLEISYRKETSWFLSDEARRLAKKYDVRIWNNSLDRPTWCNAGHCDSKALGDPDGNWGWQIKQGVGIIQTDEISALRAYLSSLGRHD